MLDLHYQPEAIVVRIQQTLSGVLPLELLDRLAAAIAYIGPEHAIVLTGSGDVFAPDLAAEHGQVRTEAADRLSAVLGALRTHPLPVVAAVNGDAIGAGYSLAQAADLRIMSGGVIQPSAQRAVRYRPRAAVTAGLVDHSCAPLDLIDRALWLACQSHPQSHPQSRPQTAVAG